jgi:3'-phosphoadenosine 5'-phosphosulfate sulfotransferase (PAPS reductase)/FAD synthetase
MTRGKTLPVLQEALQLTELPSSISMVIVSISGGKDSLLALYRAIKQFGRERVIAVYMVIDEDWPGTLEHCQRVCDLLGVRLYTCKGHYYAMRCRRCDTHHFTVDPERAWCRQCGAHDSELLHVIENVHQIIEWREMYPSLDTRLCTSMLKRDTYNTWARGHEDLLGPCPVLISGERHKESRGRAKLPLLRYRSTLKQGWMIEFRNVLYYSRREVFCELRDADIPLHYCYDALWREMLVVLHEDWRAGDYRLDRPHSSYPGQWDDLYNLDVVPDPVLDRMIDTLKYEVDEEDGAPRCSCRDCWLLNAVLHRAAYRLEVKLGITSPAHEEALALEKKIGHRMTDKASLEAMLVPPYLKRELLPVEQLSLPFL